MNDQTRWRTDDAAPLQGKVTLEPAPSMASEAKPPAPARRLEEESFEPLDALDELTEVEPALNVRPRRRHRLLAWGLGGVGLLSLGQFGAFLVDQLSASPVWGGAWLLASGLVAVG
ncbi:TIGR01620 family protein, partial [Aeromonas caviae]|nr:TIGR01620 family protein [Aeromonas caviae]